MEGDQPKSRDKNYGMERTPSLLEQNLKLAGTARCKFSGGKGRPNRHPTILASLRTFSLECHCGGRNFESVRPPSQRPRANDPDIKGAAPATAHPRLLKTQTLRCDRPKSYAAHSSVCTLQTFFCTQKWHLAQPYSSSPNDWASLPLSSQAVPWANISIKVKARRELRINWRWFTPKNASAVTPIQASAAR